MIKWSRESGFDYFKSILYDSQFMMQDTLIQKHNITLYDLLGEMDEKS